MKLPWNVDSQNLELSIVMHGYVSAPSQDAVWMPSLSIPVDDQLDARPRRDDQRLQHKDSLMDWDSLMDCQGAQSQKEGQEDQGKAK